MKRRYAVLVLLVVFSLVLSSCAPVAAGSLEKAATKVVQYTTASERFRVKLPRLYVQYDNNGVLGVGGFTTENLKAFGLDLSFLNLPPQLVSMIVNANIQHIEIAEGAEGLAIYVNGRPLPYISWDANALDRAGDLLPAFGVPYGKVIDAVLPLLTRTQLSLVIQFPVQPGAELIPFRDRKAPVVVAAKAMAVGEPEAIVRVDVEFDRNGDPTVLGLDAGTMRELGLPVPRMDPNLVGVMVTAGIQHLHFVNQPDGIHIYANNEPLPYLAWDEPHIQTAVELAAHFSGQDPTLLSGLVSQNLPMVRASEIDLLLRFPVSESAEVIPVLEPAAGQ